MRNWMGGKRRRVAAEHRDISARQRNYFARRRQQLARSRARRNPSSNANRSEPVNPDLLLLGDPRVIESVPNRPPRSTTPPNRLPCQDLDNYRPRTVRIPISSNEAVPVDAVEVESSIPRNETPAYFEDNQPTQQPLTSIHIQNLQDSPGSLPKYTSQEHSHQQSRSRASLRAGESSIHQRVKRRLQNPFTHRSKRTASDLDPSTTKVPRIRYTSAQLERRRISSPGGQIPASDRIRYFNETFSSRKLLDVRPTRSEPLPRIGSVRNSGELEIAKSVGKSRGEFSKQKSPNANSSMAEEEPVVIIDLISKEQDKTAQKSDQVENVLNSDSSLSHFAEEFLQCNEQSASLLAFERKVFNCPDVNVTINPERFGRVKKETTKNLLKPSIPFEPIGECNDIKNKNHVLGRSDKSFQNISSENQSSALEKCAMDLVNAIEIQSITSGDNPVRETEKSPDSNSQTK